MDTNPKIAPSGSLKKVLAIAPYTFLPASSGGRRAIYYLYQHLGKEVDLYCVSTRENDIKSQKTPLQFTLKPILGKTFTRYINPANYFKVKALIKELGVEVILIEHPYLGWLAWLLKITTGLPLVVRSHNIESLRFKGLGKWWWRLLADYERWVHRKASHSFFITRQDAQYAVSEYGLLPEKTSVITYGLESNIVLTPTQKRLLVEKYKQAHNIPAKKRLLLFNGIFGYPPNDQALALLLEKIYPALIQLDPDFYLIICGANIPVRYQNTKDESKCILGFVPDISELFQAAEIFLNPIWLGGGIKTKLVEALAGGAAAVSFESGAIGIRADLLEGKLKTVPDLEIASFVQAIIDISPSIYHPVPKPFLDYFDWDQIAGKARELLDKLQ